MGGVQSSSNCCPRSSMGIVAFFIYAEEKVVGKTENQCKGASKNEKKNANLKKW